MHLDPCHALLEYRYCALPSCSHPIVLCNIPCSLSFPFSVQECINVFLVPHHFICTMCFPSTSILCDTDTIFHSIARWCVHHGLSKINIMLLFQIPPMNMLALCCVSVLLRAWLCIIQHIRCALIHVMTEYYLIHIQSPVVICSHMFW